MFDTPFRFVNLWNKETEDGRKYYYKFSLPDKTRINVEIDWHKDVDLSVVKFYRDKDKNSNTRFNALIGNGYASRTILTVILIVGDFFKKHQSISLAFMAAERLTKSGAKEDESKEDTSRFRIYRYALTAVAYKWFSGQESFVLPSKFKTYSDSSLSTLVFVNPRIKDTETYIDKIKSLSIHYGELETVSFQNNARY
tara:strand:- start:721 stop:1311 length:591 start_codon:yes stop_codon:yes gene_type:complete